MNRNSSSVRHLDGFRVEAAGPIPGLGFFLAGLVGAPIAGVMVGLVVGPHVGNLTHLLTGLAAGGAVMGAGLAGQARAEATAEHDDAAGSRPVRMAGVAR